MCVGVSAEHLRVVHVPQKGISLRVQDKVSPLEAAAVLLLLDVQKAAYTVEPVHVRHAEAIAYHWEDRQTDRQTLQSAAQEKETESKHRNTHTHLWFKHTHTRTIVLLSLWGLSMT